MDARRSLYSRNRKKGVYILFLPQRETVSNRQGLRRKERTHSVVY